MSSTYEWVEGYENGTYTDDMIFDVDASTKTVTKITNQVLVSGEDRSQFIRFRMPRYYDGIDLSTKNIQIIYQTESKYSDINAAMCVERNDEYLRFGWLVPRAACYDAGILSFSLEFVGEDYVLKTITCDIEVFDGLNGGEIIPEPVEQAWYVELQQRCDYILNKATEAQTGAAESATEAATSEANALQYKTDAQASKEAAETSEANAAASEENAGLYATQAAAVFQIAGPVSFVIDSDNGVTMIFTQEEGT